eukprot:NODE_106_length_19060_cov_0.700227.p16 type:complete len:129 gc:universal NODE_106_length_19060_cov_0.700227:12121-12507(+)
MLHISILFAQANSQLGTSSHLDVNSVSELLPKDVSSKMSAIKTAMNNNNKISQDDIDKIQQEESDKIQALIKQKQAEMAPPPPQQPSQAGTPMEPSHKDNDGPSYHSMFSSSPTMTISLIVLSLLSIF